MGDWGHLLTLTLTSDDFESHIVRTDGLTYGRMDIFTGFIRSSWRRWPNETVWCQYIMQSIFRQVSINADIMQMCLISHTPEQHESYIYSIIALKLTVSKKEHKDMESKKMSRQLKCRLQEAIVVSTHFTNNVRPWPFSQPCVLDLLTSFSWHC